jgi:hypothetical protein
MDRDELQDRIRARRSGGEPYRRGGPAGDEGYERFEPEPEDASVRQDRPTDEQRPDYFDDTAVPPPPPAAAAHADLTRDTDDWSAPVPPPVSDAPTHRVPDDGTIVENEPTAAAAATAGPGPDDPLDPYDYDDAVGYPYEYDAWEDHRERRSGAGAFAILGFLALGVLALLGGALLAGVFNTGGGPVAQETPSPEIVESVAPSVPEAPSVAPSAVPSTEASVAPAESGEPVVFPDGFVAEAQPCFPGSANSQAGCDSNGAVNGGQVEIWVGFQNGNSNDVIGAAIVGPGGNTVGEGSIDLATIGCGSSCNGYTWFNFSGLDPGTYQVRVTRNGDPASSTSFEVS